MVSFIFFILWFDSFCSFIYGLIVMVLFVLEPKKNPRNISSFFWNWSDKRFVFFLLRTLLDKLRISLTFSRRDLPLSGFYSLLRSSVRIWHSPGFCFILLRGRCHPCLRFFLLLLELYFINLGWNHFVIFPFISLTFLVRLLFIILKYVVVATLTKT